MTDVAALRVVVVDDDPLSRDLLRRALGQLGIGAVGTAEDGRAALLLLEAGPVDVLVCDLNMPGMDGLELLRHLAERPGAPALAITSGDHHILRIAGELARSHRLRVLGTIPKPATPDLLRTALERLDQPAGPVLLGPVPDSMLGAEEILAMVPAALELHYQPMVDLATGRPTAVEVLARLRHFQGLVGPGLFVPLFEQRGRSRALFAAVLAGALTQLQEWRASGIEIGLAVNLSADDLGDLAVVELILAELERTRTQPECLSLELTETRILPADPGPVEILGRLRMRRVGLAIDDYGTGFSSLERLLHVPFSELKIDQAFVAASTEDAQARTMVSSSAAMARELGLTVVAEGIETAGQLALVQELGCGVGQGFHIARPMPAADMTAWLKQRLA